FDRVMSHRAMPEASSSPLHEIVALVGSAVGVTCNDTDGGSRSMRVVHLPVAVAAVASNTIDAQVGTAAASGRLRSFTVYSTSPSPSWSLVFGGRNPASGSSGDVSVSGSIA